MTHDDDGQRDETRSTEGRRLRRRAASSRPDAGATGADERSNDSQDGNDTRAVSSTEDEVEALNEAIEGEIVSDGPRLHSIVSRWSGDLPHPDALERYEALHPGLTARLLDLNDRRMAVIERETAIDELREQTVRTAVDDAGAVEKTLAAADRDALRRGQWLSWSLGAASIGAAVVGLLNGSPEALWALAVPVAQSAFHLVRTVTERSDRPSRPNGRTSDDNGETEPDFEDHTPDG